MKILSFFFKVLSYLSHFIPIAVIYFLIRPFSEWYFKKLPLPGVDFYNSVTYVSYLQRNFAWPFNGFKDIWFSGYPLYRDFVSLHWYLMVPLANYFGVIKGIEFYVVGAVFLLGVFSYLLYFQLSGSRIFGLLVALFVLYSVNIYGSATWGGSLPYFSTQFFLPLILILIVKYNQTLNVKWFFLALIASAIGFLGHPLPMFGFTVPSAAILLFFGLPKRGKSIFTDLLIRIKKVLAFGLGSLILALPISHERLIFTVTSFFLNGPIAFFHFFRATSSTPAGSATQTPQAQTAANEIANFYQGLPRLLITDTNIWIFWLCAIGLFLFAVSLVIMRRKNVFFRVFPFAIVAAYIALHPILNARGYGFIFQGWYRAFWPFPVVMGALAAALWGEFFNVIRVKLRFSKMLVNIFTLNIPFIFLGVVFVYIGYTYFLADAQNVIKIIESKGEVSSAHPQALSISTSKEDIEKLKKQLVPSFLDPFDRNKRLYEADALVNIWWNSFFGMPMARGYIDPPIATSQRGGLFWLDIAIANDSIVRDFKATKEIALQNSLFLIDWNAIYYYEGGRLGIAASLPPSSYLLESKIFDKEEQTTAYGAIIKWQTKSGLPELRMDVPQYLRYYKVKDELTSPVLGATNAPVIAIFSNLGGYEDILRIFGNENINSKRLIPVNADQKIDSMSLDELKQFDAIFLHNYDYNDKSRAFDNLTKYVENGGKLFIDSGAESRESSSGNLPKVFPFNSLVRKEQGTNWNLEAAQSDLTKNVNTANFGPLVFNEAPWKIAIPLDDKLRDKTEVILKNNGKPVLTEQSIGQGKVVWSGMNLAYHYNQYKSPDESRLFLNILNQFVNTASVSAVPSQTKWQRPERVNISTSEKPKGVLFKEEAYEGWAARLTSENNKNLRVFKAGPTYPGFMYAFLPKETKSPKTEVEFYFTGTLYSYAIFVIPFVIMILMLEKILINGVLISGSLGKLYKRFGKMVGKWWEREEEL